MTYTQIAREIKNLVRSLRKVSFLKSNPKVEKLVKQMGYISTELNKLYAEATAARQIDTPVGPADPSPATAAS